MTTLEQLTSGVEIMLPENGLAAKLLQAQQENRQLVINLASTLLRPTCTWAMR